VPKQPKCRSAEAAEVPKCRSSRSVVSRVRRHSERGAKSRRSAEPIANKGMVSLLLHRGMLVSVILAKRGSTAEGVKRVSVSATSVSFVSSVSFANMLYSYSAKDLTHLFVVSGLYKLWYYYLLSILRDM
jgi:hypothetical protein